MNNHDTGRVAGKVVIVTGAASGMGQAGTILLAEHGANVVAVDRDTDGLQATVSMAKDLGRSIITVDGDVSSEGDNERFVQTAVDAFGKLDAVWANAGIAQSFRPILDLESGEFDRQYAVNARGPWLAARTAVTELARTRGSILFTASISGIKGRADASAYQAAKGATVMLTRSLAKELGPQGIRVNSLCPLAAETPMWRQFMDGYQDPDNARDTFSAAVPLGRLASVNDVANAALFLISDEAAFISGVNLAIDGGYSA